MTDRELLELAAKAAGLVINERHQKDRDLCGSGECGLWIVDGSTCWNPLQDDGDALRLAVKLRILFRQPPSMSGWVRASGEVNGRKVCADERLHADPLTATRRAIVRTAAEIGKGLSQPITNDVPEDNPS